MWNLRAAVKQQCKRSRTDLHRRGLSGAVGPVEVHDRPAFQGRPGAKRRLEACREAADGLPDALRRRQVRLRQAHILLRRVWMNSSRRNGFVWIRIISTEEMKSKTELSYEFKERIWQCQREWERSSAVSRTFPAVGWSEQWRLRDLGLRDKLQGDRSEG